MTRAPWSQRKHRILGVLALVFLLVSLVGVAARLLPASLQALPYVPVIVSLTPWFAVAGFVALVLALIGLRYLTALVAIAALAAQVWWQWPFFAADHPLPDAAVAAVSQARADTTDAYARVMTLNVFKGAADPEAIVETVRDQRVEVLALQETTDAFVAALEAAGIKDWLPYSHVSSSDGVFGNGIWSATELADVVDDEVDSSASFMPSGSVTFAGGEQVRFVSVHTTAPVSPYWSQWRRSLEEIGRLRSREGVRYVLMGDFNATMDHAPFRDMLGERFQDAARVSGHGFAFTWPTNRTGVPRFAAIDHIVLDQGMAAGQTKVLPIAGSDHAALLATIAVE